MNHKSVLSYFSMPIIYIGILLTLILDVFVYHQLEVIEQNQTRELGNTQLVWISQSVERYVHLSDNLVSLVMREGGETERLNASMGRYFTMVPELCSMQLAPGGVVNKVYPWGKDRIDLSQIIVDPEHWANNDDKRRRKFSLSTIIEKDNGERDMLFIRPIYLWNTGNQETFWGFTIVDISINQMLEHLDLYRLGLIGINYELTWKDNEHSQEVVIASNGTLGRNRVQSVRGIDGDLWTLYLQPVHGWGIAWVVVMLTWIGFTTTGLISFYRGRGIRLKKQGEIDPLTGVFNRNGGIRVVTEHMQRWPEQKLMVIAMDIDNFKLINDVYGHEAGDKVLKQLVAQVKDFLGAPIIITRNGGDEFVVTKPYKYETEIIERLRLFCEAKKAVVHQGKTIEFQSSLGYALYPQQERDYKKLCVKADFALYNSKLNGKGGWRKFDESLLDMQERFQLGFNLADMTNHMPGAMIIYRADKERTILFASDQVINLFECENWEDFMNFTGGSYNRVISDKIRRQLDKERDKLIHFSTSDKNIEFMDYEVVTKTGKVLDIISAGNYNHNDFHGDIFYVSLFIKKHLRLETFER